MAGLLADARQLLSVARDEAKQYKYDYGVSIPVKVSSMEEKMGSNVSAPASFSI